MPSVENSRVFVISNPKVLKKSEEKG